MMPLQCLPCHEWVVMMKTRFITSNYFLQKSIYNFLNAMEKFCTDVFLGCYEFESEHFQHPTCATFSVAKFSDDGNKQQFSNPYCSAHFTCCKEAVIPYQHTNFVFGLCCHCCGWSALAGPVTNDLSTALKMTDPAFKLTYMETSAYTLLRRL